MPRSLFGFAAGLALLLLAALSAVAQEKVQFSSLEDNGPGRPATLLDAYLFRPAGEGRHPAVVFLHGCAGMFNRQTGLIAAREREWAGLLNSLGYVALAVDSLGSRNHGEMCSVGGFDLELYRKRPRDAYAALWWLQAQPYVRGDRIGVIGWSQGGGVILFSIGSNSPGRPPQLPQGDFRAAVAFYPGSCNEERHPGGWTSSIPLLVLTGADDVWTPMQPCKQFIDAAVARGAKAEMIVYPGAVHGFDGPNIARRELPDFRTRAGIVPVVGTDPAGRMDALSRVPAFLARSLER